MSALLVSENSHSNLLWLKPPDSTAGLEMSMANTERAPAPVEPSSTVRQSAAAAATPMNASAICGGPSTVNRCV